MRDAVADGADAHPHSSNFEHESRDEQAHIIVSAISRTTRFVDIYCTDNCLYCVRCVHGYSDHSRQCTLKSQHSCTGGTGPAHCFRCERVTIMRAVRRGDRVGPAPRGAAARAAACAFDVLSVFVKFTVHEYTIYSPSFT